MGFCYLLCMFSIRRSEVNWNVLNIIEFPTFAEEFIICERANNYVILQAYDDCSFIVILLRNYDYLFEAFDDYSKALIFLLSMID